ncbi:MAG: PaaI family thioesterase [Acetobacteraceae bacterium]|nr:PaaI family thioesterase [Acetobacteraceae bacterium]
MNERVRLAEEMLARASATDRQEFGSFFLLRLLGMAVSYPEGGCLVSFPVTPALFNPQGTLHGGVLATAMDISMGHLLHRAGGSGTTLEMKVQYVAPVSSGLVACAASFLREGRSVSFLQSHARSEDGTLLAHATATWKRPAKRDA